MATLLLNPSDDPDDNGKDDRDTAQDGRDLVPESRTDAQLDEEPGATLATGLDSSLDAELEDDWQRSEFLTAVAMVIGVPLNEAGFVADPADCLLGEPEPGTIDQRVLLQDEYWIDIHGQRHRVEDLSAEYRANIMAMLDGLGNRLVFEAAVSFTFHALLANVPEKVHARRFALLNMLELPGWVRRTPLGLALTAREGPET